LLSWYGLIIPFLPSKLAAISFGPIRIITEQLVRLVPFTEVYPNAPVQTLDQNLYTFDWHIILISEGHTITRPPVQGPYYRPDNGRYGYRTERKFIAAGNPLGRHMRGYG